MRSIQRIFNSPCFKEKKGKLSPLLKEKWKNRIPVIFQHDPSPVLFPLVTKLCFMF